MTQETTPITRKIIKLWFSKNEEYYIKIIWFILIKKKKKKNKVMSNRILKHLSLKIEIFQIPKENNNLNLLPTSPEFQPKNYN